MYKRQDEEVRTVEDEQLVRAMTRRTLERAGYRVYEAANGADELYGSARLWDALARCGGGKADATMIVQVVREDVAQFVAGAEASDDMAILVLQWRGRQAAVSG